MTAASAIAKAAALHADGQSATANMRPAQGAQRLRRALRLLDELPQAQRGEAGPLRGRILVTLAYAEADLGRIGLGERLLDEAETLLPMQEHGLLHSQRGIFLSRIGRDAAAIAEYNVAIAILREDDEPQVLARSLLNRGNLYMSRAQPRLARADFHRCIDVATRAQFARVIPIARHSLGYLEYLAGNVPAALRAYLDVAPLYAVHKPGLLPVLALDRARALTAVGLYREAEQELTAALAQFRRHRLGQDYAETQLARAETALLAGNPQTSQRAASIARAAFTRRGNSRWAALAALVGLRARQARGVTKGLADRARNLSDTLDGLGLHEDARVALLVAARVSATSGRLAEAQRALGRATRPHRTDRIDTRLLWRLTQAEVATVEGDIVRAARIRAAGLADLQRYRSQLGCLDLQTGASAHGRDIAEAGLAAALRAGTSADIFRWSERTRAQALLVPPARAPDDAYGAALVEQVRQVRSALRTSELAGQATGSLRAQASALQLRLRQHTWSIAGPGSTGVPASFTDVRAALGDTAMIILMRDGPHLHAMTIVAGRVRTFHLGEYAATEEALHRLRADLDASTGRTLTARMSHIVAAATRRDATTLAALILAPLLPSVGNRALVVVPTGALVTVPWAVLPGCAGREVTVALSAATWLAGRARLSTADQGKTVLVAGPGIAAGESEIREIAAVRPGCVILSGRAATPEAVLAAIDGAWTAHLATHGHHEPANPLFSSLDLVGGQLMGYDLQRLRRAPAATILSACDVGISEVRPGDETVGMVAALLSIGTAVVVASTCRISDDVAYPVMARLHRLVRDGASFAAGLAYAQQDEPTGLVCFGTS